MTKPRTMKIAYQIRAKNGALWEAAERVGGARALGKYLGLRYEYIIGLLNMRLYPGFRRESTSIDWSTVESRLVRLTGLTLEDVFPPELATSEFMKEPRVRTVIADIQPEQLSKAHERLALPPIQEERSAAQELEGRATAVVDTLTSREAEIIKRRFGMAPYGYEHTLDEITAQQKVGKERIRQIQARALRKLRHPTRSRQLLPFLDRP